MFEVSTKYISVFTFLDVLNTKHRVLQYTCIPLALRLKVSAFWQFCVFIYLAVLCTYAFGSECTADTCYRCEQCQVICVSATGGDCLVCIGTECLHVRATNRSNVTVPLTACARNCILCAV